MGGRFTQAQADDRGILAALDVTTNKLAWRQQWREICYSGSIVTAGGLLFVGRNDGRLTALDKSNGKLLWEFMTDAGVNSTVTTFEHNGEQRVVVHAGGGVFAGRHARRWHLDVRLVGNDEVVALGRRRVRRRRRRTSADLAGRGAPEPRPIDVERGRQIYAEACVACHGEAGDGGHGGGPTLVAGLNRRGHCCRRGRRQEHDARLRARVLRGRHARRRELHRRRLGGRIKSVSDADSLNGDVIRKVQYGGRF